MVPAWPEAGTGWCVTAIGFGQKGFRRHTRGKRNEPPAFRGRRSARGSSRRRDYWVLLSISMFPLPPSITRRVMDLDLSP